MSKIGKIKVQHTHTHTHAHTHTHTWLLQRLITKRVTVLLSKTQPNVLDLCSLKHELEHTSRCLLYLSTWLKLKARAHFCGFNTPKYLSIMISTLCLHQLNRTPDNNTEIKRGNGRNKVKHGAATCRSFSYLQVCLMFDAGVRVRLLPKPGSKTWHEVGDSLNNDRPLAPWYVVEQLLIQNCCLLGVQEVGEIAQPENIYI